MRALRLVHCLLLAATLGLVAPGEAHAQKPITIIVPFSPGTGPDLLARAYGQKLSERRGVPVIVDNKPGASGNIGTELAAKAPPDGHTLMMTGTTFALNPALTKAARYDPLTSFAPVGLVATGDLAFAVSVTSPAKTLEQFIERARASPGAINYASPGNGTPQHLSMELFKLNAGINLTHVPYKESAGAIKDLAGGHVEAMIVPVHTIAPLVKQGLVRILGVLGKERSAMFPDAPTLREAGVADVNAQVWFGLLAPAATPSATVQNLNSEMNAIIARPELRDVLVKQGLTPAGGTPESFAKHIKAELERWADVVTRARIRAD